ncbi:hypothetical protein ScPMuIL_018244 [Solemya velum]
MHNKKIDKQKEETPTSTNNTCNCRKKDDCPLHGNCQRKNVVYQATVTDKEQTKTETYVGIASDFKERYRNHKASFNNLSRRNDTELITIRRAMLLSCCDKCKGLFQSRDTFLDHDAGCEGNPFLSSCSLFACGREQFLGFITRQRLDCPEVVASDVQDLATSINEKSFFSEEEGFNFNTHKLFRHSGSLSDYGSCENISNIPRHTVSALDFGSCDNIGSIRSGKFVRDDLALLHSFSPTFMKGDSDIFFNSNFMNFCSEDSEKAATTCAVDKNVDDLVSKQMQLMNNLSSDVDKNKSTNNFVFDNNVDGWGNTPNFFTPFDQRQLNIQNAPGDRHVDTNITNINNFVDPEFVPDPSTNFPIHVVKNPNEKSQKDGIDNLLDISLCDVEDCVEPDSKNIQIESNSDELHNNHIEQPSNFSEDDLNEQQINSNVPLNALAQSIPPDGASEAIQRISAHDKIGNVPVVVSTSHTITINGPGSILPTTDIVRLPQTETEFCNDNISQNIMTLHPAESADDEGALYDSIQRNGKLLYKCKLCGKETAHVGFMIRHQSSHDNGKKHNCPHCPFTCLMKSRFKRHLLNHKKSFLCTLCGEKFTEAASLNRHMANHTGDFLFKCEQCDYSSNIKTALEEHNRKHTGAYMKCDFEGCNFQTIYRRALLLHKKKHESVKQFVCDICSYSTTDSGSFKRHALSHTNLKLFKCGKCDFRGKSRNDIVRHWKGKHEKEKDFGCKECSYMTNLASDLRLHLMHHAGINPFQCTKCHYSSKTRTKVSNHIKKKHSGDKDIAIKKKTNMTLEINLDDYRVTRNSVTSDIKVIELTESDLNCEKRIENQVAKNNDNTIANRNNSKKIDADMGLDIGSSFGQDLGESLHNFIVAFQCSKCSYLFTSEEALYSHCKDCDGFPVERIAPASDSSPFSFLPSSDDANLESNL